MSPPPPERPIARGIAGPGLIAQIVVSKFGDHLPLYRQEDFFVRHGLHIARSTQCDWVKATAEPLRPLYDRQKELVLQSPVLWTDDTLAAVQNQAATTNPPRRIFRTPSTAHRSRLIRPRIIVFLGRKLQIVKN